MATADADQHAAPGVKQRCIVQGCDKFVLVFDELHLCSIHGDIGPTLVRMIR